MSFLHKCQSTLESISSEWSFCAGAAAGVIFAPAALLLCLFLSPSRRLWLAAGTMAVLLCRLLFLCWNAPSFESFMDRRAALVEYELSLEDLRLSEVESLEQPQGLRAELRKLRFRWGKEKEKQCRGQVILYANKPLPRRYGTLLRGTGVLDPPESESFRKEWRLFADECESAGFENSWRSCSQWMRDKLLSRLCRFIHDDTNRNLAAAFYLGNTGGMTLQRRKDFAAAGTIHLFAVSGLHVGMAAMLILLLLRFLPFFRVRCFLAAAGVWCYVFLTGAAVPAVRAGVMIGVFLICRGMLLSVPPLRLMGIAAGIIIIADPGALSSVGFQYSFLITACLLLLAEKLNTLRQLEGRLFTIMPFTPLTLKKLRRFNGEFALKAAFFSGVTAVLAGSVVSLYHSFALVPGAVIANWFTLPVLGILFAMLPVKVAASFMPESVDRFAAQMIDMFFDYLRTVAEIMSELCAPFYAFAPGVFTAALMALLLLCAFGVRRKLPAVIAGGLFLSMLMYFPLRSWCESSKVTVISSYSDTPPTLLISDKERGEISVVDPVRVHNPDLEKALKRAGTSKIDGIYFSRPSVRNLSGLELLALRYPVTKVVLPPVTGRNWQFKDRITERKGEFFYVNERENGEKLKFFREKNNFAIEYPDSGVMLGWKLEISDRDNGRAVVFTRGGLKRTATLPWSNKNGVWEHEL